MLDERRVAQLGAAAHRADQLDAGRPAAHGRRRRAGLLHVFGGHIGIGSTHEPGHVTTDDPLAVGRVVQAITEVVERGKRQLADAVERRETGAGLLDDVHDVLSHRRMMPEGKRHVPVEQPLDVLGVRQVVTAPTQKQELDEGAHQGTVVGSQ
jgi:hypothetical protein